MHDAGFIVLWRKVRDSWLWSLSDADLRLALTCLLMANWTDREWFDGKRMVEVPRGSFITSAEKMATACGGGATRKKVRGGWARLEAAEFLKLGTKKGQKWTLVTVLNYSRYQNKSEDEGQVSGQVGARSGPGEGQVRATTKQLNNSTKEPGNSSPPRKRAVQLPPEWAPNEKQRAQAQELGVDCAYQAETFRDHAQANGRVAKDWNAAFRNWLRKAAEFKKPKQPAKATGLSAGDIWQMANAIDEEEADEEAAGNALSLNFGR